jgi:hypothetical protein
MGSTGTPSPDPTLAGGSACLAQPPCSPWPLTFASGFLSTTRVLALSPRIPPWAGTGMHVLNRGGKGVHNPVDAR